MRRKSIDCCLLILLCYFVALVPSVATAQPYDGFTFFGRANGTSGTLLNMSNAVVRSWTYTRPGGYSCYLLESGHPLRTAFINNPVFNAGGSQGAVQEFGWSGGLVWEFIFSSSTYQAHHDIEPMPNGNILMIAWELKTAAQARQAGYNRNVPLWPDHIIEVQPVGSNGGNVVWEWHAWDHLIQDYDPTKDNYGVVAEHPELLDINMPGAAGPQGGDWMHVNGISYNPELDQIVISCHNLDELYVIDHSTTTAEAAGHTGGRAGRGGDILYRWGKPSNYDAPGAAYFNVVHSAKWVPPGYPGTGNILAFNNREGTGASIVCEITPPYDGAGGYSWTPGTAYGPATPTWTYTAAGFYSNHLGWCERLPNGNTLISESTSGYLLEVNPAGQTQWSYQSTGEIVAVHRYDPCYPGLSALGLCAPEPPTELTAIGVGNDLLLRWRSSARAQSYRVYRLTSPTDSVGSGTLVATVTDTTATLADEVLNLTRGYYAVTAVSP